MHFFMPGCRFSVVRVHATITDTAAILSDGAVVGAVVPIADEVLREEDEDAEERTSPSLTAVKPESMFKHPSPVSHRQAFP